MIEYCATRKHPTLCAREKQLELNKLAYHGGTEYLSKRLVQFPNEDYTSFKGGSRYDGTAVVGRVNYSPSVNYLYNIVETINYLTFLNEPVRVGGSDFIVNNISGEDKDINWLMGVVNKYITLYGWCFIKTDFPQRIPEGLSIAQKEQLNIRPYFYALDPTKVVDIEIDKEIKWLLEEDYEQITRSPFNPPVYQRVRRLWEPGRVTIIRYNEPSDKRRKTEYSTEVLDTGINEVPFTLVGNISRDPILFDSLESMQRNILDLESSNKQIFLDSAFPREFVTASQYERAYNNALSHCTLSKDGQQIYDERAAQQMAFKLIGGTKYPQILADGESPFTPQMPSGLIQIREEINECIEHLKQISGINVGGDTKMAEAAQSKIFDFVFVEGLIRERRRMLERAERWSVYLASQLDPDFDVWSVDYPDELLLVQEDDTEIGVNDDTNVEING
jgi:hypothetical protein